MKVKKKKKKNINREILSPFGCLPAKMPNGIGLAESYPATGMRDWPTTR